MLLHELWDMIMHAILYRFHIVQGTDKMLMCGIRMFLPRVGVMDRVRVRVNIKGSKALPSTA